MATAYSPNTIADAIGADPSRTLRRLRQLRLVEQLLPVTESERRTRRKIYQISDPFLAFYLGPLQRYRTEIEQGLGDDVVDALIDSLSEHLGHVYEEAFRGHLRRLAAKGELGPRVVAIGAWWSEGGQDQIDAVVLSEPERTRVPVLAGEAKWSRQVDARRVQAKLRAKAAKFTNDPDSLTFAICAREEVINAAQGTRTVTAADIFGPDRDS